MSKLEVEPQEPPEFETGSMECEILGVDVVERTWTEDDGSEASGEFVELRLGLENGESKELGYPYSDRPSVNNMFGRLLDRFGLLETGETVDVREGLRGREASVFVTAAEDRDEETDFAEFDRESLKPRDG